MKETRGTEVTDCQTDDFLTLLQLLMREEQTLRFPIKNRHYTTDRLPEIHTLGHIQSVYIAFPELALLPFSGDYFTLC